MSNEREKLRSGLYELKEQLNGQPKIFLDQQRPKEKNGSATEIVVIDDDDDDDWWTNWRMVQWRILWYTMQLVDSVKIESIKDEKKTNMAIDEAVAIIIAFAKFTLAI